MSILQIQLQHLALLSTGSENDAPDPVVLYYQLVGVSLGEILNPERLLQGVCDCVCTWEMGGKGL